MPVGTLAGIKAGKAFVVIEAIDKTGAILTAVANKMEKFADRVIRLGRQMALAATFASLPLVTSVREYAEWDDMMRRVEGSADGTVAQMKELRRQSRALGKDTRYSAKEIGALQFMLAQKGFGRSDVFEMTPPIVTLARAAGTGSDEDVTQAADLTATIMRAFNMEAKDTAKVVDLLAKAANASNLSLYSMSEAFSYIGPQAKIAKWSIEETTSMMGVLGNFGIEASMAGTAIRGMTLSMANPAARSKFNKALMAATGNMVEMVDTAGEFRRPLEIMRDLGAAMKDLGAADQLSILMELFHIPQMAGAATLTTQSQALGELMSQLDRAAGYAKATATLMDAGIGGALSKMLQQIKAIGLSIGEAMVKPLMALIPVLGGVTARIMDWIDANQELTFLIAATIIAIFSLGGALMVTGVAVKLMAYNMMLLNVVTAGVTTTLKLFISVLGLATKALGLATAGLRLATRYTIILAAQALKALYTALYVTAVAGFMLGRALAGTVVASITALIRLSGLAAHGFVLMTMRITAVGYALASAFGRAGLMILANFALMITNLVGTFGLMFAAIVRLKILIFLLSSPITLLIAGIGLLMTMLPALGRWITSTLGNLAGSVMGAVGSAVSYAKDAIVWAFMELYNSVKAYLQDVYRVMEKTFGGVMIAAKLGEYRLAFAVFSAGAIRALAPIKHLFLAIWESIVSVGSAIGRLISSMLSLGSSSSAVKPPVDAAAWVNSFSSLADLWRGFIDTLANAWTIAQSWIAQAMIGFWGGVKSLWIHATNGLASILWKFVDVVLGGLMDKMQSTIAGLASGLANVPLMSGAAAELQAAAEAIGASRQALTDKAMASEAEYKAQLEENAKWQADTIEQLKKDQIKAIEDRLKASQAASDAEKKELDKLERNLNARLAEVGVAKLRSDLEEAFATAKDNAASVGDYFGKIGERFKDGIGSLFSGAKGQGADGLIEAPMKANVAAEKGTLEAFKLEVESPVKVLNDILNEEKAQTTQLGLLGRAFNRGIAAVIEED